MITCLCDSGTTSYCCSIVTWISRTSVDVVKSLNIIFQSTYSQFQVTYYFSSFPIARDFYHALLVICHHMDSYCQNFWCIDNLRLSVMHAWCYLFSVAMTSHKIKKYEYAIFYRIAGLIYTASFINTGIPSCMNKSRESILELPPSMPADVSGVALKETDVALQCQAFDASGVGFYEIVIVDRLKKKTY